MGKLVYAAITSVDGFIEDPGGGFDWAEPDTEVHAFANRLEETIGTHLYGRRMYETMAVWQAVDETELPAAEAEYAVLWRGLDKVVFSRTLTEVPTPRTALVRDFDPAEIGRMKAAADRDLSVSGPDLAGHAFRAGLVDEVHLFVVPVVVGGGKPGLPRDVQMDLELIDEHRFSNGTVHLHHRAR